MPIHGWVFFASAAGMVIAVSSVIFLALRLEAGGRIQTGRTPREGVATRAQR